MVIIRQIIVSARRRPNGTKLRRERLRIDDPEGERGSVRWRDERFPPTGWGDQTGLEKVKVVTFRTCDLLGTQGPFSPVNLWVKDSVRETIRIRWTRNVHDGTLIYKEKNILVILLGVYHWLVIQWIEVPDFIGLLCDSRTLFD